MRLCNSIWLLHVKRRIVSHIGHHLLVGHLRLLLMLAVVRRRLGLHDGTRLVRMLLLWMRVRIRGGLLLILSVGFHDEDESRRAGSGAVRVKGRRECLVACTVEAW